MEEPFNILKNTPENPEHNFELPRVCGNCTACCKTHPILELKKPARKWCPHCRINTGCKIYGQHPQSCKDFSCQWLFRLHSNQERPDKIGIVVDVLNLPLVGKTMAFFEVNKGKLNEDFTKTQTELFIKKRIPVIHLPLEGINKLFVPEEKKISSEYLLRVNDVNTDIYIV